MMPDDTEEPERGGDDMIAAEYVLGVLPSDERQTIAERIERDPEFARLVRAWEGHLAPINIGYAEVAPPASAKAAIDLRLFGAGQVRPARNGLFESLNFWRGLSVAALAGLVAMIALPFLSAPPAVQPDDRLVASLASVESDVSYLVVYDAHSGELGLSHVSGERAAGRDFELWVIEGANAPVSLGVIPVGANARLPIAPGHRAPIGDGALFAISLEPEGGSPTGAPTGPVVAAGDLRSI